MHKITSTAELKNSIHLLEIEQVEKGRLLKDQFSQTLDSFKPLNLLAGSINDIRKSPLMVENMLGLIFGLTTGTLSKSLFVGASNNKLKSIVGTVLQYGIANAVANNSGFLKTMGASLFRSIFRKKPMKTEESWPMKTEES